MRIVIDLQGAQTESRFRGIGRYSLSIAKAIAKNRGEHEIIIALSAFFPHTIEEIKSEFQYLLPPENIRVWDAIAPTREREEGNAANREISEILREAFLENLQPDVILLTSLFEGFMDDAVTSIKKFDTKTKIAVILYDLIPYIQKDIYLAQDKLYANYYLRKIEEVKKADLLLGISQSSSNEGIKHLSFNEDNISTISSAVDESFTCKTLSHDEKQALYKKYSITKKTIVYAPGGFDIRKNFVNLIKAYAKLPKELKEQHQLIIVSKVDDGNKERLFKLAQNEGIAKEDLLLTGYVSDEDLIAFYSVCDLFVFPSIHEGFGLPVLEAMNCGATVIGSNTTSIPEVIGCDEALFDPYSVESIRDKIVQVLTDEELQKKLKEHNKVQVQKFSWDRSAKKAIQSIENLFLKYPSKKEIITVKQSISLIIKQLVSHSNFDLKEEILINIAEALAKNEKNLKNFHFNKNLRKQLKWRVEGPFDSSYSLALLNRETARALEKTGHFVVLHSTEGPGDFEVNHQFLESNQDLKQMYERVQDYPHQDVNVVSRNLYPPRVEDMEGNFNMLHHYAWEESGFPQEWMLKFNSSLEGMTCLSKHVEKVMLDNGVSIPLITSGCGVDHWENIEVTKRYSIDFEGFKFLHVSSCFPRKGADVMLDAYGKSFSENDDVLLVIKTFKNPHNEIHKWLDEAKQKHPNYPKVMIIEEDLNDATLKSLYEECDVLLAPSLAEGFGLPMAEAMLSGLPVITTNWSGQLDFCNQENSWLVDFKFERAKTHFNLFNSVWAKPDVDSLSECMIDAFKSDKQILKEKADLGRKLLLDNFKWIGIVGRMTNFVYQYKDRPLFRKKLKLAWISTWNTKCGIATYSDFLLNPIKNQFEEVVVLANHSDTINNPHCETNVIRCWTDVNEIYNDELKKVINSLDVDCIVIQYNFGFFNLYSLEKILKELIKNKKKIFITFHSVKDVVEDDVKASLGWISETLKQVHIFVHSIEDLNVLKSFGLVENVTLFPHGVMKRENDLASADIYKNKLGIQNKRVISSYGFMLPHKGIKELIESFIIVKNKYIDTHLLLVNAIYPNSISQEYADECQKLIEELKLEKDVTMINDFLSDEESFKYLDCSDLLVMPYRQTQESSSAAVRYAISTNKPVVCTPISIFDDVSDVVHFTKDESVEAMAEKIDELLGDEDTLHSKYDIQQRWIAEYDWSNIAQRLRNIIYSQIEK